MQLPESPGEQAGIWNGECVSFRPQGRVSLIHLKNSCPQHCEERGSSKSTLKINCIFTPSGQQMQDCPISGNASGPPQRQASPNTLTEVTPLSQRWPLFSHDGTKLPKV